MVTRDGFLIAVRHSHIFVQCEQDGHLRLAFLISELTCFLFRGCLEVSAALRVSFTASLRFWILALLLNGGLRSEAWLCESGRLGNGDSLATIEGREDGVWGGEGARRML